MARKDKSYATLLFRPGEVLVLLTPLQELQPGMYLLYTVTDEWVVLRWLIDDEAAEKIVVTERESTLPATLLKLFMPIGLQLSVDGPPKHIH